MQVAVNLLGNPHLCLLSNSEQTCDWLYLDNFRSL
jgi:hypothetical protein